jgi:hypothetical protein
MQVPPDDITERSPAAAWWAAWWARYYMVELRTQDDQSIARLVLGTQSLDRARAAFDSVVGERPLQPVTLRQRARVLRRWPED